MVEDREKEWKEKKEPDARDCLEYFIEQTKEKEKAENQEYLDYLAKAYPTYELNREICGKTKDGKEVVGLLGEGGYARVYACNDKNYFNESRAVKIMKLSQYPQGKDKIIEEFKLQHEFKDVSVEIKAFPPDILDESFYGVSMEMMNGTLRDLLKENGGFFDAVDTVRIMKDVALLVEKLHMSKKEGESEAIAHFDLKPDNILYKLRNGKRIFKLSDYGCARKVGTTVTTIKGTEKYVCMPGEPGPSCDMYALGLMLMELQGANIDNREQRGNPEMMWEDETSVDLELREISRKTCHTNIAERYSIDEFIAKLDSWLASHEDEVAIKDGAMDVLLEKAEKLELESSTGMGDPISLMARALKFYKAASEKKSGKAAYRLYKIFDQDEKTYSKEKVMEQLEYSKNLNYAPALNEYACRRIQELGPDGDPVELMQMIELLRCAADDSPAAAYNLAVLMKADLAPETSKNEAENFLAKAAAQNFEAAIQLQKQLAE